MMESGANDKQPGSKVYREGNAWCGGVEVVVGVVGV